MRCRFVLSLGIACVATSALAGDGVLEINETCALLTGCFPGDTAGLPVTITVRGSYRLTSNLDVSNPNTVAVSLGPSVDLDLAGFTIGGPTTCPSVPAGPCAPAGAGVGIAGASDVRVHDGEVRGMGADGIALSFSGRVERVHVSNNGRHGIAIGGPALVRDNLVVSNGGDGIHADIEAQITGNAAVGNGASGIRVISGVVANNSATRNGGAGADLGVGVAFSGNVFLGNNNGSRIGGSATGGNVCDDGACTRDGRRRYYLTPGSSDGANVLSACGPGFHMASFSELADPSELAYDRNLGFAKSDQGAGAPSGVIGWARTGQNPIASSTAPGRNCLAWTTSSSGEGSLLGLPPKWWDPATHVAPWESFVDACGALHAVWCIED